jgi:hypothetical protein
MRPVKTRVRVWIFRKGEGIFEKWREAEISVDGKELRVSYTTEGESTFTLSSLFDIEPGKRTGEGTEGALLKFRGVEVHLAIDENPMIYDSQTFWRLIHAVFEAILNGVPVLIEREKAEKTFLRLIQSMRNPQEGNALLVDRDSRPVLNFAHVINGDRDKNGRWKLELLSPTRERETLFLEFPDDRSKRLLLRYLLWFVPFSRPWAFGIARKEEIGLPDPNIKLTREEVDVLDALLSGVNPLEVPALLRMEVGHVETIYARLIKLGLLRLVGIRKVVEPTEFAELMKDQIRSKLEVKE